MHRHKTQFVCPSNVRRQTPLESNIFIVPWLGLGLEFDFGLELGILQLGLELLGLGLGLNHHLNMMQAFRPPKSQYHSLTPCAPLK